MKGLFAMGCLSVAVIGLNLLSMHIPQNGFNDSTQGVYVRNECGYQVGVFKNSEGRTSFHASKVFESKRFFLSMGVVSGYKGYVKNDSWKDYYIRPLNQARGLKVFIYPGIKYKFLRVGYIPKVKKYSKSHTLHLSVEFTW